MARTAKVTVDVADVFGKWSALADQKKALNAKLKELEKEMGIVEKMLVSAIPVDEVKDGVQHVVTVRANVAYGKALEAVREQLVAKTKQKEVDGILAQFTTESTTHRFKAV